MSSLRFALLLLFWLTASLDLRGQERPGAQTLAAHDDSLPAFARQRLGTLRFRNGTAIASLSFAPDGRTLLSIGHDRVARLWETATGKELGHFTLPRSHP